MAKVPSSPILVTLMMEAKRWFLQEPHAVTSQQMAFFIVTAVKTPNLTHWFSVFVKNYIQIVNSHTLFLSSFLVQERPCSMKLDAHNM
jgi:hypothetical protein